MPHGVVTEVIPAPRARVFELLHDYNRRLEWDTLLQAAYLTDGFQSAQLHATSICQSRWYLGAIALKTEYVVFKPPAVAAVKLVAPAPFFESFAASIHHRELPNNQSEIEYQYTFTARPKSLRWLLHPIMSRAFAIETRKRLKALSNYLARLSH